MKHGAIIRIVLLVAVVAGLAGAVRYLDRLPPSRLASLLGITVTVSDLQGTPLPGPAISVLPISDQVPVLSLSAVAVQTFSGSTLIRSAAGTVVTSDGLIVTTTAGAPYGAYVYQIATAKGVLLKARRVAYDAPSGLVLLKADGGDMDAVALDQAEPVRAGEQLTVLGATVSLAHYAPVVLPATVAYAVRDNDPVLSLDKSLLPVLTGARVVDRRGRTVGLLRQGATVGIISAATVDAFVDRYLAAPTPAAH